jgi:hypothetical protein
MAAAATASAMSWIRQRETARPWFSSRSIWTRGGTDDDPGVPVERAVGRAALGGLVDVAGDGGDAVGGLVVLLDRALGGELDRADGDGRAVGVELPESLGGGDDPGLVESLPECLLEVEHGAVVGDLDLEGE